MAKSVSKVPVWAATIEDKPGGLAEKLAPLAAAGASLDFVIARRTPEDPAKGVVFLTPLKGAKQLRAARQAGFKKTTSLHSVRLQGPDKPGLGAAVTRELAAASINLRGMSATAIGRSSVVYLAFDTGADANKAIRILTKM